MKKVLLPVWLCFSFYSYSQTLSDNGDTLTTTSGFKMYVGQDVKLGPGTLPNGNFKYVQFSQSGMMAGDHSGIGKAYSGHLVRVKRFRRDGTKKRGYTYAAVVGGGNITNYEIDPENAIASGELVVPAQYQPHANTAAGTSLSVAEQLEKLNKLYKDSVITKEEFDAQKKKALSQ